jgi:hypothetical protein
VPQGGRQFVYKLVDGPDQDTRIAQRVEVKVGIRQPGKVEITEGLMPGDMVVTAGQQRIQKDGMAVRCAGPRQERHRQWRGLSRAVRRRQGAGRRRRWNRQGRQSLRRGRGRTAHGAQPSALLRLLRRPPAAGRRRRLKPRGAFHAIARNFDPASGLSRPCCRCWCCWSARSASCACRCASTRRSTSRWSRSASSTSGASAEVIESQVTKPLEDSIAGIDAVDVITSISRPSRRRSRCASAWRRTPTRPAAEVRDRTSRVRNRCPQAIEEPVIAKVEADAFPVIWLAFTSDTLNPLQINDLVNRIVKPRLQTVTGVADVRIFGERKYAMRVWLDPRSWPATGLTTQDVEDAIRRSNLEVPAGPHRVAAARVQRHLADRPGPAGPVRRDRDPQRQRLPGEDPRRREVQEGAADERSRVRPERAARRSRPA